MNDVNAFLFGGGGHSFKFENIGDTVSGEIISIEMQQQTSVDDNKPLYWEGGQPRLLAVFTLQTDLRDPDDDSDEGIRTVWAKGGKYEVAEGTGMSMKEAIRHAAKKAGLGPKDELVGGTLTVGFTGLSKRKGGMNAAKLYSAKYTAPAPAAVSASDLWDD